MFVLYVVSSLFFLIGIGIKYFKWYFLIAGYNTMSKKQKEKVDIEGLAYLMGNFMIFLALLILGAGVLQKMGYKGVSSGLMLLIAPLTVILVILAQKYDHNNEKKKSNKTEVSLVIAFILGINAIVVGMLIVGVLEPKIEVTESHIVVASGMYKRDIRIDGIEEVTLEESMPQVLRKVNGFNMGYTLRGSFDLKGEGNSSIFVYENRSPFIYIRTTNQLYIINFKDDYKTKALYEAIRKKCITDIKW